MVRASLHEHLIQGNKFPENSFNRIFDLGIHRMGNEFVFSITDFCNENYSQFIGLKGYERRYIGKNKRAVVVGDNVCVHSFEVPTKQGHLLVLGLNPRENLTPERTLEDTIKQARDYHPHVTIIPTHSHYYEGTGDYLEEKLQEVERQTTSPKESILSQLDALEIFNGEASFGIPLTPFKHKANQKSLKFYQRAKKYFPNLGSISSTDGHSFYEFAKSWTEIQQPTLSSEDDFLRILRNNIKVTNTQSSHRQNTKSGTLGAINHILYLLPIVIKEKLTT